MRRIDVVLPLPFGPRKPKISPRSTRNERSTTTCLVPKLLLRPWTSMTAPGRRFVHFNVTLTGCPGCSLLASSARRPRLDHEHELAARLVAVDDGRRELRFVRDVGERRRDVGAATVALDRNRATDGEAADDRLRHEEAHLHVLRRQHPHDGAARRDPLAFSIERVEHPAGLGRQHGLLVELPRRLLERRPRRRHLRSLRLDLLGRGSAAAPR